jgi:transposase
MQMPIYTKKDLVNMERWFLEHNYMMLQKELVALSKNSSNSSIPPSIEDIPSQENRRKKSMSLREKSGKKTWWQGWHTGTTRRQAIPDKIVQYAPASCPKCKEEFSQDRQRSIEQTRQVVDIPEIKFFICNHQLLSTKCSCWCTAIWKFPENINAPVQFGNNMKTAIVYYHIQDKLPINKIVQTLSELYWITVSEWTVVSVLKECAEKCATPYNKIMEHLKDWERIGSDETWNHSNWEKVWVWVRQNDHYTYLTANKSRSHEVVKENLWEDYDWVVVHDCFWAQNNTHASKHQLCLVHIHRDCNFAIEIEKNKRMYDMRRLLLKAQRAQKVLRSNKEIAKKFQQHILSYYKSAFDKLLHTYYEFYTTANDPPKETTKLWKRLTKHKEKIFVFLENLNVPSHNNQSEWAIRNQKTHQKVSWWFRTMVWAEGYCKILSIIHSLSKQERGIFQWVKDVFDWDFSWR